MLKLLKNWIIRLLIFSITLVPEFFLGFSPRERAAKRRTRGEKSRKTSGTRVLFTISLDENWFCAVYHFILVKCANVRFIVPRPLGMESGDIKDSQITASSETTGGTRYQSRLNAGPEKAWCVNETDSVRALTIDLQREYSITKVKSLKYVSFICIPNSV